MNCLAPGMLKMLKNLKPLKSAKGRSKKKPTTKANHLGSPIMSHEPEEEAGTHINPRGPQWGSNQRRLDGEDGTHTTRVQGRLPGKAQLGRVEFE